MFKLPPYLMVVFWVSLMLLAPRASAEWRPGEMKVKIDKVTPATLQKIQQLGIEIDHFQAPALYLHIVPAELKKLRKIGIQPDILIPDMQAYARSLIRGQQLAGYHDYPAMAALFDSLRKAYPQIVHLVTYGSSVRSRPLIALKISDHAAIDEAEPEVSFDGGHHGDEVMSSELLIRLIKTLCKKYGRDDHITRLINSREIWFFPMVNPDGRQTLNRRNFNHVDLNRDWGYMWDGWGNSPRPYSQPETRAMLRWILSHQFVISQSLHSGMEVISYPWSYRPNSSPDHYLIRSLAGDYVDASEYDQLSIGQGFNKLYPINGSAKDSYYGIRGSLSWTMEISARKNPAREEIKDYFQYNFPAIIAIIEAAGRGLKGSVRDETSGRPIPAVIWVSDDTREYWPVYNDPAVGDFHKYLLPGTYTLQIFANGYKRRLIPNVIVDEKSPAIRDITLQRQPGNSAYQVLACRIPGNNYSDEGLTYRTLGKPDRRYYSLGKNGWIVLDMGEKIYDLPGNDIRVVEGDLSAEGYSLKAAGDFSGPWISLGENRGTAEFDLATAGLNAIRYLRIEDDGDGFAGASNAGFDLDAVEGQLRSHEGPHLVAADYRAIDTLSNFNGRIEAGELVSLELLLKNFGRSAAANIEVGATCQHPGIEILDVAAVFDKIDPEETAAGGVLRLQVAENLAHNTRIPLTLNIRADNDQRWVQTLPLSIFGGSQLRLDHQDLSYKATFTGFRNSLNLQIHNAGKDTLKIFKMKTADAAFSVDKPQLMLPPGRKRTVAVAFQPQQAGIINDTLTILSNDPKKPLQYVSLRGEGLMAPELRVAVDSVHITAVSDSTDILIPLDNRGAGELRYSGVIHFKPFVNRLTNRRISNPSGYAWAIENITDAPSLPPQAQTIDVAAGISRTVETGFSFPFHGKEFSSLRISPNGFVVLGEDLPNNGTIDDLHWQNTTVNANMIAPMWARFVSGPGSRIAIIRDAGQCQIYWIDLTDAAGRGPHRFMLTLDRSGVFFMSYESQAALPRDFISGWQAGSPETGITVFGGDDQDRQLPAPGEMLVVEPAGWAKISAEVKVLAAGASDILAVKTDLNHLNDGQYAADVLLTSNDPTAPLLRIPLHVTVRRQVAAGMSTGDIPGSFVLQQNYPNPFNPRTTITFKLPQAVRATLIVYNTLGQPVRTIVNKQMAAGEYRVAWEGLNDLGQTVPSGIYFYELRAAEFYDIKKMILLH